MELSLLNFTGRKNKKRKRVGRGNSSQRGKTSCRGHKGAKSRSGYKRRAGKEGGQLPLYQKLPYRGFSNARFKTCILPINLERLEQLFDDGDTVNIKTLTDKGLPMRRMTAGFKVLAKGTLNKKITIVANAYTKNAIKKLEKTGIDFKRA